jgi:hypothetical protein
MKLMMVLLVLISRELLTPQWRALLVMPSYWWRDLWLKIAEKQKMSRFGCFGIIGVVTHFCVCSGVICIKTFVCGGLATIMGGDYFSACVC